MSIFKACDVRGVYPDEINETKAYRIGRAIATILDSKTLVVGGDVRLSTPGLKTAIIDGLIASSCDAIDIGTVPTPAFYFSKDAVGAKGGVMVTASHNPPEYNGLKISLGALPITPSTLARIRSMVETNGFLCRRGRFSSADPIPDYITHTVSRGKRMLKGLTRTPKVVLDCGNGCYSSLAPAVFQELCIPFVPLYCEVDGSFPNRSPNSAIASNLTALCEKVVEERADLGIAFDGDGDRISFVDETGTVLSADEALAVIVRHKGGIGPGEKVVLDIKCGSVVSETITSLGAKCLVEKSGHTFIKTRVIMENAALGGEASGHVFHRELGGGDDGLYSALLMTGIVGRRGRLSALAGALPQYAATPDLRIRMEQDTGLLEAIAAAFPPDRVTRLDGVRVQFDDGWGLARLSVTEPAITLRFEARDEASLGSIMDRFLAPAPELKRRLASEA